MRYTWVFDPEDDKAIQQVLQDAEHCGLVAERRRRNCCERPGPVSRELFLNALLICLLTSQQRSGPESPVVRFLGTTPFPLTVGACDAADVEKLVAETLAQFGGIRSYNRIGEYAAKNLPLMTGVEWQEVKPVLEHFRANRCLADERRAANFIHDRFWGIGPKQARNLLQMVGLTRLVVPLDSRTAKWMRAVGFPVPISADLLGDRAYYEFVEDGLISLAQRYGVDLCVLDAAVFSSFEETVWSEENTS